MPAATVTQDPSAFEPPKKIKYKKYLRHGANGLLVTGMVFFTGFMSFSGAILLKFSIYGALAAFFFAGIIEGEVYAHNISRSLLMMFSGEYLKDLLVAKKLGELVKKIETSPYNTSKFLKDYNEVLEYVQELEETHDEDNRAELEKAKKRLKWMRRQFKSYLLSDDEDTQSNSLYRKFKRNVTKWFGMEDNSPTSEAFYPEFRNLVPEAERKQFQKELHLKKRLGRFSWILNLIAGVTCYLVGLNATQIGLSTLATYFGFALTGTALSTSVVGLAVLGGLGYTLLIHNTINDMIHNDTLKKWYRKTLKFFLRKKNAETGEYVESKSRHACRIVVGAILVGIIVSLGVFATIATAGTWWSAAKLGAETISWLKNGASPVRSIGVILMAMTQGVFNIVNSLKSAKEIAELSPKKMWQELQERRQKYRKAENDWQYWNPVRITIKVISWPFTIFSFVGHLISMSLMGNQLDGVDPNVATGLNTASEGLTDYNMIFPETHPHGPNENDGAAYAVPKKHKHHAHDHTHADIPGKILIVVLTIIPLYPLSATWDWYHSKKNTADSGKKQLTYLEALKKAYLGLPDKREIKKPQLSSTWLAFEKQMRVDKVLRKNAKLLTIDPKKKTNDEMQASSDQASLQELQELIVEKSSLKTGTVCAPSKTYLNSDGTINLSTFFQNRPLSQQGRIACAKLIQIANTREYHQPILSF